jgi:aldose 1-epimerase
MPCGLGLHPYFPCSETTELTTRVSHVWLVDEDILPTQRVPADGAYDLGAGAICGRGLDNGYEGWGGMARISTPGALFTLNLSSPDAGYF